MCQMQTRREVGAEEKQGAEPDPESGGPILVAGSRKCQERSKSNTKTKRRLKAFSLLGFHFQWQLEFPLAGWLSGRSCWGSGKLKAGTHRPPGKSPGKSLPESSLCVPFNKLN